MTKLLNYAISVFLVCALASPALAARHLHLEKEYQQAWCAAHGGVTEYVLEDKSRVDILLPGYAIEVDFAPKWAEAIGQALYYAQCMGLKPGIVLIMENPEDRKFLRRLSAVARSQDIKVWTMRPADLKAHRKGGDADGR